MYTPVPAISILALTIRRLRATAHTMSRIAVFQTARKGLRIACQFSQNAFFILNSVASSDLTDLMGLDTSLPDLDLVSDFPHDLQVSETILLQFTVIIH